MQLPAIDSPSPGDRRIVIGIDWADRQHAVCVIDPLRLPPQRQTLAQRAEDIAQWAAELRARHPDRELCVALETSQGPLFHALLATGCLTLFPVNPRQLARFREALHPTGKKDDHTDAELLARLLLQHPERLRPCRPDDELTRKLARLTELIAQFRAAAHLTQDPSLIEPQAAYAQHLARQLGELARTIAQFEADIAAAVAQHPDAPLFRSLPGAGDALVPRLIAAFGSDRERYQSAAELQNLSGIAPVTVQSGQSRRVQRRRACPKFLRQTFHEFADHARKWSRWSRAWYDGKRAAGMRHHAAVRALAYKWLRILFRLWKQRATYSEDRYVQTLIDHRSPIAAALANPASAT